MAWRGRGSRWPHPLVLPGGLYLGRVQPQEDGAGPLNQRFSDCTVSRTHLGSGDSESVGLGREKIPCSNSLAGQSDTGGPHATLRTAEP